MSDEDDLFSILPLNLVVDFLTLNDVLSARLSCHALTEGVDGLSPKKCASFLTTLMLRWNIYPIRAWDTEASIDVDSTLHLVTGDTSSCLFERVVDKQESKEETLCSFSSSVRESCAAKGKNTMFPTSAFGQMIRCCRVFKHLPNEFVVAFNGKYGRYCLPIVPNESASSSSHVPASRILHYPPCQRGKKCPTCLFRIPPSSTAGHHCEDTNSGDAETNDNDNDEDNYSPKSHNNIYDHVQILGKKGNLDLTRFYNVCAPNLPPDLRCPLCRNPERTLVLSEVSYKSSTITQDPVRVMLTYTPDSSSLQQSEEDSAKSETTTTAQLSYFAPLYDDFSMKVRRYDMKPDSKHAVSIHCVSCKKFGILSPASPCIDPNSKRSSKCTVQTPRIMGDIFLGSTFVRKMCASDGCLYPVSCLWCTSRNDAYQHQLKTRQRYMYCDGCGSRFCRNCTYSDMSIWAPSSDGKGYALNCGCCDGASKLIPWKRREGKPRNEKSGRRKRPRKETGLPLHRAVRGEYQESDGEWENDHSEDEMYGDDDSDEENRDWDYYY